LPMMTCRKTALSSCQGLSMIACWKTALACCSIYDPTKMKCGSKRCKQCSLESERIECINEDASFLWVAVVQYKSSCCFLSLVTCTRAHKAYSPNLLGVQSRKKGAAINQVKTTATSSMFHSHKRFPTLLQNESLRVQQRLN
jgi:hypothetical protein